MSYSWKKPKRRFIWQKQGDVEKFINRFRPRIRKSKRTKSTSRKKKTHKKTPRIKNTELRPRPHPKAVWKKSYYGMHGIDKAKLERFSKQANLGQLKKAYAQFTKKELDFLLSDTNKPYEIRKEGKGYYKSLKKEFPYAIKEVQPRGGINLGQYPNPLGYDKIIDISLRKNATIKLNIKDWFWAEKSEQMMKKITFKISYHLNRLKEDIINFANSILPIVPEDTGKLRDKVIESLENSECCNPYNTNFDAVRLKMRISADIPYAGIVNEMPTKWVRHDISMRKYGKGGILHDPEAEGHFFDKLVELIKAYARVKSVEMIDILEEILGTPTIDYKRYPERYEERQRTFRERVTKRKEQVKFPREILDQMIKVEV